MSDVYVSTQIQPDIVVLDLIAKLREADVALRYAKHANAVAADALTQTGIDLGEVQTTYNRAWIALKQALLAGGEEPDPRLLVESWDSLAGSGPRR